MSLSDTAAYCEESDVQAALQETDLSFDDVPLGTANVEAAIFGASQWFNRQTDAHFYDSNADPSDLISDAAKTASNIRLSVPSSPHRHDGQLFRPAERTRTHRSYPNTRVGRYARVKLPAYFVESIDTLEVRSVGGDVTDWVASSDFSEGKGDDYYLELDGRNSYGQSYLYVHAGSLGPRVDFEDVLTVGLSYGLDWQDDPWADVRRGIAHLAAAELVTDDDVLTQIPDNGQLVNLNTQSDLHWKRAKSYLFDFMEAPVR